MSTFLKFPFLKTNYQKGKNTLCNVSPKNRTQNIPVARNGPKGILTFLKFFCHLSLKNMRVMIPITLPAIYALTVPITVNGPETSHNRIAIRRSHHHIHFPPDTKICKKKKRKTPHAPSSDQKKMDGQKYEKIPYKPIHKIVKIPKSIHSENSHHKMLYKLAIISIPKIIMLMAETLLSDSIVHQCEKIMYCGKYIPILKLANVIPINTKSTCSGISKYKISYHTYTIDKNAKIRRTNICIHANIFPDTIKYPSMRKYPQSKKIIPIESSKSGYNTGIFAPQYRHFPF